MSNEMIWSVVGAALIVVAFYDIYTTILFACGANGPISDTLIRTLWRGARALAFRLPRRKRHWCLNSLGPVFLPVLLLLYLLLLTVGYALVYYPRVGSGFMVPAETQLSAWQQAFYFSGVSLLTVGYGDVVPVTAGMRLVALSEAAAGLGVISLGVTYLLTVYGALERKRMIALSFYYQAGEGADVAGFISHYFVKDRFVGIESALRAASRDVQSLFESHFEHPIIHYFHPREVYKSLPRVLFLQLEICAVLRTCLKEDSYDGISAHPEVKTLEASAGALLSQLVSYLGLAGITQQPGSETPFEESHRWRSRFLQTIAHLRQAGISPCADTVAGEALYCQKRGTWERELFLLSRYLGYDWDEITGDRNLSYAANEELEIPPGSDLKVASAGSGEAKGN